MRFRNRRVRVGGVDDRRRRGGAAAAGGGLGVVGLLIYVVVSALGGGGASLDPSLFAPGVTSAHGTGESLEELEARCNAEGALERHDDCFLIKVYNEINVVWDDALDGYRQPQLAFFEGVVRTGCGPASSEVGPFYCPPDEEIFIDLGFLDQLQREFGAEGRAAEAYILAHEVGHHVQTLLGTERDVRRAQQRDPGRRNELSIRLELQADCYAGVWGALADERGNVSITERDLDVALNAASAVGDDRIQQKTQGRVDPESWTHGSSEQRRTWYLRGFQDATLETCDTFA